METPMQKFLEGLKHNINGVNFMLTHENLTSMDINWLNAQMKTLTDIRKDIEDNFLINETEQIKVAFDFGYKYGIEGNTFQNSDTFFNDMYSN